MCVCVCCLSSLFRPIVPKALLKVFVFGITILYCKENIVAHWLSPWCRKTTAGSIYRSEIWALLQCCGLWWWARRWCPPFFDSRALYYLSCVTGNRFWFEKIMTSSYFWELSPNFLNSKMCSEIAGFENPPTILRRNPTTCDRIGWWPTYWICFHFDIKSTQFVGLNDNERPKQGSQQQDCI